MAEIEVKWKGDEQGGYIWPELQGRGILPNYAGYVGHSNARWAIGYFQGLDVYGSASFGSASLGSLTVTGSATVDYVLTVHGDAAISGKVTSNLIPTSGKELGSNDFRWNNAWSAR